MIADEILLSPEFLKFNKRDNTSLILIGFSMTIVLLIVYVVYKKNKTIKKNDIN